MHHLYSTECLIAVLVTGTNIIWTWCYPETDWNQLINYLTIFVLVHDSQKIAKQKLESADRHSFSDKKSFPSNG